MEDTWVATRSRGFRVASGTSFYKLNRSSKKRCCVHKPSRVRRAVASSISRFVQHPAIAPQSRFDPWNRSGICFKSCTWAALRRSCNPFSRQRGKKWESQVGDTQLSQCGGARKSRYFVALFLDCDHRGLCEHGLNAVREDAGYADRNARSCRYVVGDIPLVEVHQ